MTATPPATMAHQPPPADALPITVPTTIKEGFNGNLTPEQERILRTMWVEIFKVLLEDQPTTAGSAQNPTDRDDESDRQSIASSTKSNRSLGKRMGNAMRKMSSRNNVKNETMPEVAGVTQNMNNLSITQASRSRSNSAASSAQATPSGGNSPMLTTINPPPSSSTGPEDKYDDKAQLKEALSKYSKSQLRHSFWELVKFDHPDVIVLRILRARKWDIEKSIAMLLAALRWRIEMDIEDIIERGEEGFQDDEGFVKQLQLGKSFLYGTDKEGRPVCYINVQLHTAKDQSIQSLEKFTVYTMETCRLLLKSPVETACIIFDMTGFGLKNMDYDSINFLVRCFEAYYPESLGICLVHKAPWIFWGIWKIVSGLLDPVVRSKIVFTRDDAEIQQYIPAHHVIPRLDGKADWEYKYVPVQPGENEKQKDVEGKAAARDKRFKLESEFETLTSRWCAAKAANLAAQRAAAAVAAADSAEVADKAKEVEIGSDQEASALEAVREQKVLELQASQWELEKYTRGKTLYHRLGIVRDNGGVVWDYGNGVVETRDVKSA